MAGEAKTTSFMLGSASVLIGTPANVWNLDPTLNSIGLVKNFTLTAEPGYTDLGQGVKNQMIYSTMTSNVVKATMEVFEYTSQNLQYALGLDGTNTAAVNVETTLSADALAGATTITVASVTNIAVGNWILIQVGTDDQVTARRVTARNATTRVLTLNAPIPKDLATGTAVRRVNAIDIGSKAEQPFLAAEIIGNLADGTEVRVIMPKLRITNGFTMGFVSDNYGNLPFEFTLYDQVAGDPLYGEFSGKQALLLTRT